jgi:roundabout axon guidance receptor 4
MMASWASVTDGSNSECTSARSSLASSSDGSFLTEADFATAVAKAAELSGLTVVGSTVCDPSHQQGKQGMENWLPRPVAVVTVIAMVTLVAIATVVAMVTLVATPTTLSLW